MSLLPDSTLEKLSMVAEELSDVFAERACNIDAALECDSAFGSGWTRSALARDLAVSAASGVASRIDLDFRPVNGSGREFRELVGGVDLRIRLRKAKRARDGQVIIKASSDSALTVDPDSLFAQEPWVFGYILSTDGLVGEVFVAHIIGYIEGTPGFLELGPTIPLGAQDPYIGSFIPKDEGLLEFDETAGIEFGLSAS